MEMLDVREARILKAESENKRYRKALEKIYRITFNTYPCDSIQAIFSRLHNIVGIIKSALEKAGKD